MINRNLDTLIEQHFLHNSSALLLTGARQTGKTVAIRKYAQTHDLDLLEINFFEDTKAHNIFKGAAGVEEVLLRLSSYADKMLVPGRTLVFLDEIQRFPDALTWVKFLVEDGRFRYALSGSLLGVELQNIRSVPVGTMDVVEVFPLSLSEFACAVGVNADVMQHLRRCWEERCPVDGLIHEKMMQVVSLYLMVGGMPAVVQTYLDTKDLRAVQQKQKEIMRLYKWDISQYDPQHKLYLDEIFSLIPAELNAKNKRFILKDLNEHRQFDRHENGFIWLRDAGVALPTYNVEEPCVPLLLAKSRSLFKLFQSDVGLLASQYSDDIPLQILSGNVTVNFGAIYENLVAQELRRGGFSLYFFNSKKQGEVDFLIEQDAEIIPIEVKSGKDYQRHRALNNIMDDSAYAISQAFVLTNDNLAVSEKITYAPIYMIMFFEKPRLSEPLIYELNL